MFLRTAPKQNDVVGVGRQMDRHRHTKENRTEAASSCVKGKTLGFVTPRENFYVRGVLQSHAFLSWFKSARHVGARLLLLPCTSTSIACSRGIVTHVKRLILPNALQQFARRRPSMVLNSVGIRVSCFVLPASA
jgi:hypothetical protein